MLGEAVTAAGLVMWLAYFTYSPKDVALALIAMGLPFVVAGPVAATLTRVEEPAGLFKLVGRLRVGFALALIGLHFHTFLPVLYLLLFGISLCGRLRAALRIAAMRACLAPGEPERVAASTHFAAVVVAVIGPLLAALLYILNGERILLVAFGAATIFVLGTSADALVESIPPARRAFLLAQPTTDLDDGERLDDADADALDDDEDAYADYESSIERREARLPEWEQWGPGMITEAIADVKAGLTLAGSNGTSVNAMRALAALALVGGGLSVLEVFYVTDHLLVPTYYLGALLAAEGAGLALGATFWRDLGRFAGGRIAIVIGMVGTGLALSLLAVVNLVPIAMAAAVALGAANAVAVDGARGALRAKFDGLERRALAAAEGVVTALCGLCGAGFFVLFHAGFVVPRPGSKDPAAHLTLLSPFSPAEVMFATGLGLVVAGVILAVLLQFAAITDRLGAMRRAAREARERRRATKRGGAKGRVPGALPDLDLDDDDDDYADQQDDFSASQSYAAAGRGWDDDADDYDDRAGDPRYGRSYGAESQVGWDDEGSEDDPPPTRGGRGWRR